MASWRVHKKDTEIWAMRVGFDRRQARLIGRANNNVDALYPGFTRPKDWAGRIRLIYQWPARAYNVGRHFNAYRFYPWFRLFGKRGDSRTAWSSHYAALARLECAKQNLIDDLTVADRACVYLGYALHSRQDMFFHPRVIGHQSWWDDERDPRRTESWRQARDDTLLFLKEWREALGLSVPEDWDGRRP